MLMVKAVLPLQQRRVFPARLQRGCHTPPHFHLFLQSCKTSGTTGRNSNVSQRNPMVLELPTNGDKRQARGMAM